MTSSYGFYQDLMNSLSSDDLTIDRLANLYTDILEVADLDPKNMSMSKNDFLQRLKNLNEGDFYTDLPDASGRDGPWGRDNAANDDFFNKVRTVLQRHKDFVSNFSDKMTDNDKTHYKQLPSEGRGRGGRTRN